MANFNCDLKISEKPGWIRCRILVKETLLFLLPNIEQQQIQLSLGKGLSEIKNLCTRDSHPFKR